MFYACFTLIGNWESPKNFRVGIFFNKKLVRVGLQETDNFFLGLKATPIYLLVLRAQEVGNEPFWNNKKS